MLEIELKFSYNDDIEARLQAIGAKLKKHAKFEDVYYDNEDTYFLTANNYWLRTRTIDSVSVWELKYPYVSTNKDSLNDKLCTYYENNNEVEICELILKLYNSIYNQTVNEVKIDSLFKCLNLKEFSRIITERKTYVLNELKIDLDEADFGYKVGEIEYAGNIDSSNSVKDVSERINLFAAELGISTLTKVPGKMDMYLLKHNTKLYELIQQRKFK